MLGLNWVDLVILLIVLGAIWVGRKLGSLHQVVVALCFFVALFVGGAVFHHILPIDDRTILTIVNTNLVLCFAIYAAFKGYDLSVILHRKIVFSWYRKHEKLDARAGVAFSIFTTLIAVWLLTATISRLPFVGLSNSTADSLITRGLHAALPPAPAVFAVFNAQLDPNSTPYVFNNPTLRTFEYDIDEYDRAVSRTSKSVVKVSSFGCGGYVSGTGFVLEGPIIVTNAHVIAGVTRPVVFYEGRHFEAYPVYFNANLDVALLKLTEYQQITAPPLKLTPKVLATDSTVAVIGYPGGEYAELPGKVRDDIPTDSRNIYDMGLISRTLYVIQARIRNGSSGSPVVDSDGLVAGVIFSSAFESGEYAFAIKSSEIIAITNHHGGLSRRVGTGFCHDP
jgi:S1-C subfamily serine protease